MTFTYEYAESLALAEAFDAVQHSYTQVEGFKPHEWVVNAIMAAADEAFSQGKDQGFAAGREEGYAEGYQDGEWDGETSVDDRYDEGYQDGFEAGQAAQ